MDSVGQLQAPKPENVFFHKDIKGFKRNVN